MDFASFLDMVGEPGAATLFGLVAGLAFGVSAQRSRFCMRAATVEFAHGRLGPRMAVWLLCFSTALVWVQGAELSGLFRSAEARMMAVTGSVSGAVIGGLMFGIGMVLARGCSGRLLVLAASGNMRSLVAGMIFAVVAQMSMQGWLTAPRDWLAGLWVTPGGRNVDLLAGLPDGAGLAIGLGFASVALGLAWRNRIAATTLVFASGVGFAVALGWVLTFRLSQAAFDPVQVESMTFTGPSANTLMFLLDRQSVIEFDIGLIPGVFLGAFAAAAARRELALEAYEGVAAMRRSIIGAALMGFGGMLAGGCAIGAGVTGGSIFAGTAWLALFCMWIGAVATDVVFDQARFGLGGAAA